MEEKKRSTIRVENQVKAPVGHVWKTYTEPDHIKKWNQASDDWHTPRAESDMRPGGRFNYRMESKDGAEGFDFEGTFNEVRDTELLAYTLGDGRKVKVDFRPDGDYTQVTQEFEAEDENPEEMQKAGWQSILDNFKGYSEGVWG